MEPSYIFKGPVIQRINKISGNRVVVVLFFIKKNPQTYILFQLLCKLLKQLNRIKIIFHRHCIRTCRTATGPLSLMKYMSHINLNWIRSLMYNNISCQMFPFTLYLKWMWRIHTGNKSFKCIWDYINTFYSTLHWEVL